MMTHQELEVQTPVIDEPVVEEICGTPAPETASQLELSTASLEIETTEEEVVAMKLKPLPEGKNIFELGKSLLFLK